jgi:hypothetical protein
MESFSLLLGVRDWTYSRQHHRDLKTGEYEAHRSMTLRCFWNNGAGLLINGQLFYEPFTVLIRIGEPIYFTEPLDLDYLGTHYRIGSGLGGARHHPKFGSVDSDDVIESFINVTLVVSSEVFAEIVAMRQELRIINLDVIGDKVDLDVDGEPSWNYSNSKENVLYITGFSYTTIAA